MSMFGLILTKFEGKYKRKKIQRKSKRKIKNRLKINKLFLFTISISFYLF